MQMLVILTGICCSYAFGQVTKEQLFNNGIKVFEKGYYISAIEYFDRVIAMDSTYAIAYYYKGLSYKKGTHADIHPIIVSSFKKAIQLDSVQNFWEAYFYLAQVAPFTDTAFYKLYDKAIYFQPNNSDIYFERGDYHWRKRDFIKALSDYEKSLQLNNENVKTLRALGFHYYTQIKDLNKALYFYDRAIKLKPTDTTPLFSRAQILCKLGKLAELEKDLKTLTLLSEYLYTSDKDCHIKLEPKNKP